ncbi:MAG TPA: choice-of-anchor Q domain-containing protein [Candidatus Limnocylindrales bacterium]|nr:choice-of-anchor Q domain-containing protein [Candidatus Limnocylindrales bacterium]
MKTILIKRAAPLLVCLTLSLQFSTLSLTAAVLTVTSLADSGPGSLRDEVGLSAAGDTIQFAVNGTILLSSAINIPHTLNLLGPGPSALIVNANHVDRAFVTSGSSTTMISGMTIINGFVVGVPGAAGGVGQSGAAGGDASGGAIYDGGNSLTLSNCWLVGNTAQGGPGGFGGENPPGAGFTPGNGGAGGAAAGGAVYCANNYPLVVVNCSFSDNRAAGGVGGAGGTNYNPAVTEIGGTGGTGGNAFGGAVNDAVSPGGPDFTNSTFSANDVSGGQGGAGGDSLNGPGGQGGGGGNGVAGAILIFQYANFTSCTIVSNSAFAGTGGGGGNGTPPGPSGMPGSGSGGGVVGYTIAPTCVNTIGNTILADNFASTVESNYDVYFGDNGYNFIGSLDLLFPCGILPTTQVGTVAVPIHPQLGPLAQNGGGLPTHATSLTSPVTDQGYSFGLTTDERGAPRPYVFSSIPKPAGGDGSDIGAFELGSSDLGLDTVSNNLVLSWPAYYGDFTLQSATNLQGSNNWTDVPGTPIVVGSQLVVTNPITSALMFYRLINH